MNYYLIINIRFSNVSELGNPRGNENPFLLTFGIVWFKWHNTIALNIKRNNPDWSSDKIYNEARKWVIATQQHIIVNEWLPLWLGSSLPVYKGKYVCKLHACRISIKFSMFNVKTL
jgi:dual oxidase